MSRSQSQQNLVVEATARTGAPDDATLARAVVQAVAYADIFDYPLTAGEIHRYLVGVTAQPAAVLSLLAGESPPALTNHGGYITLAGRGEIIETRLRRAEAARRLWPEALRYGRVIAGLPFVRMVAVTGALAVDNVEPEADIDYLIVTEPGRLWLCRALIIALVRWARRKGVEICPNYLLSEQALLLSERSLYTAHELAQMIPLAGSSIYWRMRQVNAWSDSYLPNAVGPPQPLSQERQRRRPLRAAAETLLRTPAGGWLERWEMNRKVAKFSRQQPPAESAEIAFCADWCKGHFDGHGRRTLGAFAERLRVLETGLP